MLKYLWSRCERVKDLDSNVRPSCHCPFQCRVKRKKTAAGDSRHFVDKRGRQLVNIGFNDTVWKTSYQSDLVVTSSLM